MPQTGSASLVGVRMLLADNNGRRACSERPVFSYASELES